jgi:multimeric flavodoxin WrbA
MATILIIYHSQTGNTEKLAQSVAKGVEEVKAKAILKQAFTATIFDLKNCDGLIICSPEYFGYMAGAIKDFFDRTYEEAKDDPAVHKKPYAIVISAGNDGSGALTQIERIGRGYRFKMVQAPIISKGEVTKEVLEKCYLLGMTIAEGIDSRIF